MNTIVAKDKEHLLKLIKQAIFEKGNFCDLNFIDTSKVTDMSHLFSDLINFNGDISKWNTSNVENMASMFEGCHFNGDISQWNTSKVQDMNYMFCLSDFNGDISAWDVSNVKDMSLMFYSSKFSGDLEKWKPLKAQKMFATFQNNLAKVKIPYWAKIEDYYQRVYQIQLFEQISKEKNNLVSVPAKENLDKVVFKI